MLHLEGINNLPPNIVFFDGLCHVCDGFVNLLLKIDKRWVLTFASLQGETYHNLAKDLPSLPLDVSTVIFYSSGSWHTHSEAILRLIASLGGFWKTGLLLLLIPRIVRDAAYKLFARYRYRWFGQREYCRIPTAEIQRRFLP